MRNLSLAVLISFLPTIFVLNGELLTSPMQKSSQKKAAGTVMTGYLVDKMCAMSMVKHGPQKAMEKAKRHTVACSFHEECASSGFGLVVEGKFFKFTSAGDSLALDYLKKTKVKDNVLVDVVATREGDLLKTSKISQVRKP